MTGFRVLLPPSYTQRAGGSETLVAPRCCGQVTGSAAPRGTWLLPAFRDPCGASTPKDFGIKFLNLECEFLRHEVYSECGVLCPTQKQLWEGPPRALPGLTLEPGVKSSHPRCSGRGSVQVASTSRSLSWTKCEQGCHTTQREPGWGHPLTPRHSRLAPTHSKSNAPAQLGSYHHTTG